VANPAVSVIIPVYNRYGLLERAVRSVLAQTVLPLEIIVVDDGSSGAPWKHELTDDALVSYHRLPCNHGVSFARNRGVERSRGQLVAFLDSDDEWLPEKLEKQLAHLAAHPHFRIAQSRETWIRNGRRVNPPRTHEKKEGDIFMESLERCMITPSSVIMERSLFWEAGGFNESLPACEDYDLWLKITAAMPVGLVDEHLLIRYGGHGDQLSLNTPVLDRFRIRALLDLLHSGRLSPKQYTATRNTLRQRCRICAQGAKKRGNETRYESFNRLAALL